MNESQQALINLTKLSRRGNPSKAIFKRRCREVAGNESLRGNVRNAAEIIEMAADDNMWGTVEAFMDIIEIMADGR